jgi:hypothetical protein
MSRCVDVLGIRAVAFASHIEQFPNHRVLHRPSPWLGYRYEYDTAGAFDIQLVTIANSSP